MNRRRMNMSTFHRLKILGVLAGIALFFLINRIFHSAEESLAEVNNYKYDIDRLILNQRDVPAAKEIPRYTREDKKNVVREELGGDTKSADQTIVHHMKQFDDDYTNFLQANEQELRDPFVHQHRYEFVLNNKHACNGNVFVVILIHSAPNKKAERQDIRNTWGSVRFFSGASVVPMFLLAETENKTLQNVLVKESQSYRDIIQGNFVDSYRNLTYKNVMGLHWVQTHCEHAKFILKVDDDTMVDVYHLIHFLFQKSPDGDLVEFLYCSTYKNQGPRRIKGDKWFVTKEEYPYSKYPPYCEGFAYIMSRDVARRLYEASSFVKIYWIDDVYVTGFLALKSGIFHRDLENGHAFNLMTSQHLSKHAQSSIFLLAKYEMHRKNWDKAWIEIQIIHDIGD